MVPIEQVVVHRHCGGQEGEHVERTGGQWHIPVEATTAATTAGAGVHPAHAIQDVPSERHDINSGGHGKRNTPLMEFCVVDATA